MARETIQELVDRRRKLIEQIAEVDAEIRSRHGEQPAAAPVKKTPAKK